MIPEGYRLLTAEDVGKVFGIDLEVTVYVYFENDYVDFPSFWSSQKQLTDFITYNYAGYLGGAYISFDSGIISGADNLWLNATPPFEYCTITEGTELTTFNTDADWNTWLYVKDKADPKTQFISDMNDLSDSINNKAGSSGKKTIKEMKSLVDGIELGEVLPEWDGSLEAIDEESMSGEPVNTLKKLLDVTGGSYYLFYNYKGESVDDLINYEDTSNVINMSYMFKGCINLTTIPLLDTSKVEKMNGMFNGCAKLTTIPQLDVSNVLTMESNFTLCSSLKSILMYGMKVHFNISFSTKFEREDLVVILNNLATVASTQTLTMGTTNLAKLTDEDKAIATNKNWTLA